METVARSDELYFDIEFRNSIVIPLVNPSKHWTIEISKQIYVASQLAGEAETRDWNVLRFHSDF